jgi:hypothetical protein
VLQRKRPGFAIVLSAALAGCSSAAGWHAMPTTPAASHAETGGTRASLVIHIPRRHTRAHYVSPNTKSASLAIAPGSGCTSCSPTSTLDFGLTPGSPGCHTASGETTCTIELKLKPGTYVGSFVTYDGPLGVSGTPSGNVLSANQSFPMNVKPGIANAIGVTLAAVPAFMQFTRVSGAVDLVPIGYNWNVDLLGGSATGVISLSVLDQDANVIVGPGAPTLASVSAGAGFVAHNSGNTITIDAPATVSSTQTSLSLTLSSPECAQTNAQCTPSFSLAFEPVLAIVNGGTNTVLLEAANQNSTSPGYGTVSSGIYHPADVKFDAIGNLFVANQSPTGGSVLEYAAPYNGAPATTITNSIGTSQPFALDLAPNKSLAVALGAKVLVYASPYTGTPVSISLTPNAIAFDANSNLWIAESGALKRYTATSNYATADTTITDHVNLPASIAIDNNGDLYVADTGNREVYLYKSPYGSVTSTVLGYGSSGGGSVAVIPGNGDVFICAAGNNEEIFTGLFMTDNLNTLMGKSPTDCRGAFDNNADLWVTDPADNGVFGGVTAYGPAPGWIQATFSSPGAIAVFPNAFIGT